jgi:hypothetical protein
MDYTTLNKIRKYSPCSGGWDKLLKHLSKTKADDEPLSFKTILKSNDIADAIWAFSGICILGNEVTGISRQLNIGDISFCI